MTQEQTNALRQAGNTFFKNKEYDAAIEKYSAATEITPKDRT